MDTFQIRMFYLLVTWCLAIGTDAQMLNAKLVNPESLLLDDLLRGYNKDARPFVVNGGPVQVTISLALGRVAKLDEKQQILTTFGWLVLNWEDPYLRWNPSNYSGITKLVVDPSKVWMPEIALLNTVEDGNDLSLETKFRTIILPNGKRTWLPGVLFATTCPVDLTYFPFDHQACEIRVINWSFQDGSVNFTVGMSTVIMSFYQPNGEWDIVETHARRESLKTNPTANVSAPIANFTIVMKRKPLFYMLNILSPCIMMSLMSVMVFSLPAEAGEKVSLNISILLSYSVLMLLVSDIMPKNAEAIPILAIFLTVSMALTGCSLFCTVGVLNIHYHSGQVPLPGPMKAIFLRGLGRLLCMRAAYTCGRSSSVVEPAGHDRGESVTRVQDPKPQSKIEAMVHELREKGFCITKRGAWGDEGNLKQSDVNEWHLLASVFDRFFLVLFALMSVATILTIMGILHSEH